jgi:hypothetical protein
MQSRKWTNHPIAIENALPSGCPRPATAAGASRIRLSKKAVEKPHPGRELFHPRGAKVERRARL